MPDHAKTARFPIGLSGAMFDTASYREHLEAAAENAYDSIQLRSIHVAPGVSEAVIDDILAFVKERHIALNGLSCFTGNYGLLDDTACSAAFENFTQYVALAVALNAGMLRVWPGWQASAAASPHVWKQAARWMRKSADYASERGIRIAMEMHHGTLCDSAAASVRLLEEIGQDNVGVMLDPVNLYQAPADYGPRAIASLADRIFDVHVKDIVALTGNYFPYAFEYSYYVKHIGRFAKVVPPQGSGERYFCHRRIHHGGVDWASVIHGLQQIHYRGYLTVESVCENNRLMPEGRRLAAVCKNDLEELLAAMEARG